MSIDHHEFETLASVWLTGQADADQTARLGAIVEANPAARDRLLVLTDLHACLATDERLWGVNHERHREHICHVKPVLPTKHLLRVPATLAFAAGLLLGCVPLVYAFSQVAPAYSIATPIPLADGSFEERGGRIKSGFPTGFGIWSGDESEAVENPSVEAHHGKRTLRLVRAEREPVLPNFDARSCDVYQLVDLRSSMVDGVKGQATLELSVQFLDARESAGEKVKFICRLHVFSGSPDSLIAQWPITQKDALASGSGSFDSDGGSPLAWRQVATKVLVPPQADFAVVHLVVHMPNAPQGSEATFGKQFADDVRLTLKTQPSLPVRLSQQ
jgi:hypothetical protein